MSQGSTIAPSAHVFRVSLHWDARLQSVGLSPLTVGQLHLQTKQLVRITQAKKTGDGALAHAPSMIVPFVADASVSAGAALLPLSFGALFGYRSGAQVCIDAYEEAAPTAPAAHDERDTPYVGRVIAQVWKPGVPVRYLECGPTDDAAVESKPPFHSPPLADIMHEQVLMQPRVILDSSREFRILPWHGLVCLARIRRLVVFTENESGITEEDISSGIVDEDTEVECEVMTEAPVFYARRMAAPTLAPPLFPHMLQTPIVAPPETDTSLAACFPKEWRSTQQFVHNALQSHVSARSSTTSPSAALGFGWSIPRAMLLAGPAGSGTSSLIDAFVASVASTRFNIRRTSGIAMINQGTDSALMDTYTSLARDLVLADTNAASKIGVLILEDLDAIVSGERQPRQPAANVPRGKHTEECARAHSRGALFLPSFSLSCSSDHPHLSTQLLSLLDRLHSPAATAAAATTAAPPLILLIASVKQVDSVPSHFLSTGKFESIVKLSLLGNAQRERILQARLREIQRQVEFDDTGLPQHNSTAAATSFVGAEDTTSHVSLRPVDRICAALSGYTPGYVAADLAKLVQYTLIHASLRWDAAEADAAESGVAAALHVLTWSDFESGLKQTHPSNASTPSAAMQLADTPSAVSPAGTNPVAHDSWPTVAGYETLKARLDLTLYHWLHPDRIQVLGLRPISGVLFHGPSGCGKGLFASALARHAGLNFVSVSVASVFSQYLGESERKIRALFAQAAQLAPCVLLLDHVDAIAGKRDGQSSDSAGGVDARVLSTLLNEMDGISKRVGVYVVGCTSHPDALDSALMRPGRFDDIIAVELPSQSDREAILRLHTRQVRLHADVDLPTVAHACEGLTGADLKEIVSKAGMNALRADQAATQVTQRDMERAIEQLTGRVQGTAAASAEQAPFTFTAA